MRPWMALCAASSASSWVVMIDGFASFRIEATVNGGLGGGEKILVGALLCSCGVVQDAGLVSCCMSSIGTGFVLSRQCMTSSLGSERGVEGTKQV